MTRGNEISAVDLFCGVGGLTHGLLRSGIRVRLGVDIDPACKYPYEENNDGAIFLKKSVAELTTSQVEQAWGNAPYRLLAGCAPCQPFSTYSQAWDPADDERWPLLLQFGRLVRKTLPDFVTMENVPQLEKQDVFRQFKAILAKNDYTVWHQVVNCSDYGVPQQRNRLVLLASLHGALSLEGSRTQARKTVRQAIGDLRPLVAGETDGRDPLHRCCTLSDINLARIKASKPGGTWRDWPKNLQAACHARESGKGYVSVYGRMPWDEPSPTMTTQFYGFGSGRFGHPEQNRAISLREGAILQSFPKGYKFVEPGDPIHIKTVGRLIGNAVPVKIGESIGKAIKAHVAEIQGAQ